MYTNTLKTMANLKTDTLQIMSLNTNGLRKGNKRRSLFNWLKQFHKGSSKITFLQETHTDVTIEQTWKDEWGGEVLFSHGTSGSKGVAILLPLDKIGRAHV
jgi:exonuclease III